MSALPHFYAFDAKGKQRVCIPRRSAVPLDGGQAEVVDDANNLSVKLKLYHTAVDVLSTERKLQMMLSKQAFTECLTNPSEAGLIEFTWPQEIVYEDPARSQLRGFSMPRIDRSVASSLRNYLHPKEQKAFIFSDSVGLRLKIAVNLTQKLVDVHRTDGCVPDLNAANIYVNRSGDVSLIDCDGFSFRHEGRDFLASAVAPEISCPERQRSVGATSWVLDLQQERFALGIQLFRLLNRNIQPYDGYRQDGVEDPIAEGPLVHRIREGYYPYGLRRHPYFNPIPDESLHEYLPESLRRMFDQCFQSQGASRPTAEQWLSELDAIRRGALDCSVHGPGARLPTSGCPLCHFDEAASRRIARGRATQQRAARTKRRAELGRALLRGTLLCGRGLVRGTVLFGRVTGRCFVLLYRALLWTFKALQYAGSLIAGIVTTAYRYRVVLGIVLCGGVAWHFFQTALDTPSSNSAAIAPTNQSTRAPVTPGSPPLRRRSELQNPELRETVRALPGTNASITAKVQIGTSCSIPVGQTVSLKSVVSNRVAAGRKLYGAVTLPNGLCPMYDGQLVYVPKEVISVEPPQPQSYTREPVPASAPAPAVVRDEEKAPSETSAETTPGGTDVLDAQRRLRALGLPADDADGVLGPLTQEGIRALRLASGLPENTELTAETLGLLRTMPPTPANRARALKLLAQRALAAKQIPAATRLLENSERLSPDATTLLSLGDIAWSQSDFQDARSHWLLASQLGRGTPAGAVARQRLDSMSRAPTVASYSVDAQRDAMLQDLLNRKK